MRYLTLLLLMALPVPIQAQVTDAGRPPATDTLSFYGMQMYVSVVSGQVGNELRRDDSTLKSVGYSKHGEFYLRQWPDPITDDTLFRLISFSEEPASVGMEGTNLDSGGILRLYCNRSQEIEISVLPAGFVYGGSDSRIGGTVRFDDDSPQQSGSWTVSSGFRQVRAPESQLEKYWLSLRAKDTMAVRLDSDAGPEYTYLFALEGFTDASSQTPRCLDF